MAISSPSTTRSIDLPVTGTFDLHQSIDFGFGQRRAGVDDVMRLAFCLDGLERQVGVAVRQPEPARLTLEVVGDPELDEPATLARVGRQVARVLSVDIDGRDYDALGRREPAVGRIQATRPGLRPPLFYSAYEAALWGILSARQPAAQMFAAREELARRLGRVFTVAGEDVAAAPLPHALAGLTEIPGVRPVKIPRLQALGRAAGSEDLDTEELRGLDPEEAGTRLRRLAGIGPFYAELVTVRALGHTDLLAGQEPKLRQLVADLAGSADGLSDAAFAELTDTWRPWRTWVSVALRASAHP
jgi:DNA-3-methyladenine glycosylase II